MPRSGLFWLSVFLTQVLLTVSSILATNTIVVDMHSFLAANDTVIARIGPPSYVPWVEFPDA